jgi:hypothetical protein
MSQANPQIQDYIKVATKRQEVHLKWEKQGSPFIRGFLDSIEEVDKEFWTVIDKMEGVVDINIVRNAEIEAGILESYRAYS